MRTGKYIYQFAPVFRCGILLFYDDSGEAVKIDFEEKHTRTRRSNKLHNPKQSFLSKVPFNSYLKI